MSINSFGNDIKLITLTPDYHQMYTFPSVSNLMLVGVAYSYLSDLMATFYVMYKYYNVLALVLVR